MENKSNKLSKKEIEALIPDYIFNNLTQEQRSEFEIAIVDYPDLEFEVEEGKALFSKIDKMDFDKILKEKTDYLPEKIVLRLQKQNIPVYNLQKKPRRWLLPAGMAAAVILILFFNPFKNKLNITHNANTGDSTSQINTAFEPDAETEYTGNKNLFSELEKLMLYEEFSDVNIIEDFEFYADDYAIRDIVEENIDEIYYMTLENNLEEFLDNSPMIYANADINQRIFLDNLIELGEDNFKNILEGMLK